MSRSQASQVDWRSTLIAVTTALLSAGAGPCAQTSGIVCATGSVANAAGQCVSGGTTSTLTAVAPLGSSTYTYFSLIGANTGFALGTSAFFSTTTPAAGQNFTSDADATFGGGPLPEPGLITEAFTAVAVYSASQASAAGVSVYDAATASYVDLTGFSIAVGYALSTSGSVVGIIARYTPRGVLDTEFNHGTGYILGAPGGFTGGSFTMYRAVAIDSQGRIVVGGYGNTRPTSDRYLHILQKISDYDPFRLRTGNERQELKSVLARFLPTGDIDGNSSSLTSFDASAYASPSTTVTHAQYGNALQGFTTGPATGYNGSAATTDARFDIINGLAIDAADGIFIVGTTGNLLASPSAFIAHYNSTGLLLSRAVGSSVAAAPFVSGNHESFSAVTMDPSGRPIAVGQSQTFGAEAPPALPAYPAALNISLSKSLVTRFTRTQADTTSETLVLDTSFNSGGVNSSLPGSLLLQNDSTLSALTYDTTANQIVVTGKSATSGFVAMVAPTGSTYTIPGLGAPYVVGATQTSFLGVAQISGTPGAAASRYFAVGGSVLASTERSLLASFTPGALALDTATFKPSPYTGAPSGFVFAFPLPPFNLNFPSAAFISSTLGTQSGPSAAAALGGGDYERFNAITTSPDGTHVIVVGYTTDQLQTLSVGPLHGRSLPLLLMYSVDGTFPNLSSFSNYRALQLAL